MDSSFSMDKARIHYQTRENRSTMFRRTFLSLSVLPLISGTAIASTLKSVDLLIVGAGAAGLAAACRAAELGIKNVVIIEKEPPEFDT